MIIDILQAGYVSHQSRHNSQAHCMLSELQNNKEIF